MTALCTRVCMLGRLTTYRKLQMSAFKYFTMVTSILLQLISLENECEGLLPDCSVGVKESESEDDSS